ncbi:MAG: DNA primase [Treponema sp.]|jgi:DNA primase|nr:DNA primase [Treponema sp.]
MSLISQASIAELNERLDAVEIVSEYVQLTERSGRWWGLCPFHHEKTSSFTVNPERGMYYCFGCHKGGSLIDFVMEMDKLTYREALETLAKKAGVQLAYEGGSGQEDARAAAEASRKEQLFDLYRRLAGAFHHCLMQKPEGRAAKGYILSRAIGEDMLERFNLGYAPAPPSWLHAFLRKKGYSDEFLAASGLFSMRHSGYPLFADRLIFPISDRQGRVAAFGGRVMPAAEAAAAAAGRAPPPKYLNSPETAIYRKGETLFAIDKAVPEIRRTREVYLAEGYMDVLALHAAGVTNAVAPLGTAFTDSQAKLLRRWAEKAILVFDTDAAGQNAAVKAILTCRKGGLEAAVTAPSKDASVNMKDPADILQHFGPEVLKKSVKNTILDSEYLMARARASFDTSTTGGMARAAAFLFPYVESLDSEVSREACIKAAADGLGVDPAAFAADYHRRQSRSSSQGGTRYSKEERSQQTASIRLNEEVFLLCVAALNPNLYATFRNEVAINEIDDPAAKEIFIALEECFAHEEVGLDSLLARISSEVLKKFLIQHAASKEFFVNPAQLLEDGIREIRKKRLRRRISEITRTLRRLKGSSDPADRAEEKTLLEEKMDVDKELQSIANGTVVP